MSVKVIRTKEVVNAPRALHPPQQICVPIYSSPSSAELSFCCPFSASLVRTLDSFLLLQYVDNVGVHERGEEDYANEVVNACKKELLIR